MYVKLLLMALIVSLVAALAPIHAVAQQPEPEIVLGFEPEPTLGKGLAVAAYLLDPAGNPIEGEVVTFSVDAKFMNTLGRVEIGQAITGETGLALLVYTSRLSGERTIKAEFLGNDIFTATETSMPVLVSQGPETYTEDVPFRIPGANIGVVTGVLIIIWTLYLSVVGLFWRISRAGGKREGSETRVSP